ncbi:MAG TPA: ThuA domain-containing protein [Chitinophagaceae bacterium]|nr:ThuA domain-containing protein [Chitinophagaceae bacterium]
MKKQFIFFSSLICILLSSCKDESTGSISGKRILVFAKTNGFHHSSIPNGKAAIQKLGKENDFDVDVTDDSLAFAEDNLKKYAAVVFLNTTGNILSYKQEAAFERFIQAGGGFVGIHSATDTEYDWIWYSKLVGANFESHPKQQNAKILVVDKSHASTKHLPDTWERFDEWYNFKNLNKDVHVLAKIDEKSYEGGKMGDDHPMAWYHDYDGGRAFYTEFGHTEESYVESNYLKHILGGIQYAIGENKKDYSKAKSQFPPDPKSFTKTQLSVGEFFEPTEMTILPNLDVLIVQRRGDIAIYKNDTKQLKPAGKLDVYWKTKIDSTVNAEEGLLGVCKDPNFAKNNWVYIFYSPIDTSVNRLSRFTLKDDKIDLSSEKIVLQFYSQREICCHTGGSIAFGGDGNLYLSTGDNSTPFDAPNQPIANHGFAPLDNRKGFEKYDARRSASNSNDLRGKVIRIKVNEDGTYSIPDGNLFAKDQPKTRPEIYAMGTRNAYRLSVDPKNNYVYWGDVGPDSDKDSLDTRGSKGYDELNQAKKAGYFGWPLFIGKNYPYHSYDYYTGKSGPSFDPAKPINDSKNNTGIKELPPLSPPFIWYPYGISPDFPQMGTGGRTAMAGPIYYSDLYPGKNGLPDYYNGKVFIYEWMRNIIRAVSLQPNGDFYKMEPFMDGAKFAAPVDIELGPDGHLYVLEYGLGWFSKNKDSGLFRIDYKE